MELTDRHKEYWRKNVTITLILLAIWAFVTFVVGYFARDLTRWLDGKVPVGVIELIAILPVQSWADDAVLETVPALATLRGTP